MVQPLAVHDVDDAQRQRRDVSETRRSGPLVCVFLIPLAIDNLL
jgi:hypothetical protein